MKPLFTTMLFALFWSPQVIASPLLECIARPPQTKIKFTWEEGLDTWPKATFYHLDSDKIWREEIKPVRCLYHPTPLTALCAIQWGPDAGTGLAFKRDANTRKVSVTQTDGGPDGPGESREMDCRTIQ